jgi:hypothetical protein
VYSDDDIKEVALISGDSTTDLGVVLQSEYEGWKSFLHGVNNNYILLVILDNLMAPKKILTSLFEKRMLPSKPTLTNLIPTFPTSVFVKFLNQLTVTNNRDRFLLSYPDKKPSVSEQIQSFLIHTLTINNLGFYERTGMDEKTVVEKAVYRTVKIFVEVQKYRPRLSVRQQLLFRTPLLDLITNCQPIKVRKETFLPLNLFKIKGFIKTISSVINQYPSWYCRTDPQSNRVKGYGVLMELNNVSSLVWNTHLNYLLEQNERNIFASEGSSSIVSVRKNIIFTLLDKQP